MKQPLPIGTDDFARVRENGYYYVDKSLMIKDFVEIKDEVALMARPTRFGKTLNMTMLREFFVKQKLYQEYLRYEKVLRDKLDRNSFEAKDFYAMIDVLRDPDSPYPFYSMALQQLTQIVKDGFGIKPVLLIDEYDQPIISSYE